MPRFRKGEGFLSVRGTREERIEKAWEFWAENVASDYPALKDSSKLTEGDVADLASFAGVSRNDVRRHFGNSRNAN